MSEWTNVMDKFPENHQEVLIYIDTDKGSIRMGLYAAYFIFAEQHNNAYFTGKGLGYYKADEHAWWMPLPEPPTRKGE